MYALVALSPANPLKDTHENLKRKKECPPWLTRSAALAVSELLVDTPLSFLTLSEKNLPRDTARK